MFSLFFPFIVENLSKKEKQIYFILLLFFIFVIFYFQIELMRTAGIISELGGTGSNPNLNDLGYILEKMKVYSNNSSDANSAYKLIHENNFIYYFKYLFEPFILDKNFETTYLLAKFESLYYFYINPNNVFFVGFKL